MYMIFMLIAVPALAIGWYVYWRWDKKMTKLEEQERKERRGTDHLQSVKNSFEDYTKKLENFERKNYDKKNEQKNQ